MGSDITSRQGQAAGLSDSVATAAVAIAAVSVAVLAGAWFMQLVLGIQPCPLCLEQRYAYYAAIPVAGLIALCSWRGVPRAKLTGGLVLLALAFVANAALGVYHAGIEWAFWQGPTDCSGPIVDFGKTGNLLDDLNKVKVVRCDQVQWRVLGLSLAGYSALISFGLAVLAVWGWSGTRVEARTPDVTRP